MNIKTLIFGLYYFITLTTYGQVNSNNIKLVMGDIQKGICPDKFIGFDDSEIYAISPSEFPSSDIRFFKYNNKMNLVLEKKINLSKEDKEIVFTAYYHDKIYLFYRQFDSKTKKNTLYIETINKETLSLNNDSKKITEISCYEKYSRGKYHFSISPDKSKFMICAEFPGHKNTSKKFNILVFGKGFENIWNKEFTLDYDSYGFDINNVLVNNDGEAIIFSLNSVLKGGVRSNNSREYFQVTIVKNEGESIAEIPLKNGLKRLIEPKILLSKNGDMICSGFYSDNHNYDLDGCFFINISKNNDEIAASAFNEFEHNFIHAKMEDTKNGHTRVIETNIEFQIKNIVQKEDGGIIFVGEKYSNYETTHDYEDIVIINLSAEGKIIWKRIVRKKQLVSNIDAFYSFVSYINNKRTYLIFNDNEKNINNNEGDKIKAFKPRSPAVISIVEVDSNNNMNKNMLFDSNDAHVYLYPTDILKLGNNECVFIGMNLSVTSKHRLFKITFNE